MSETPKLKFLRADGASPFVGHWWHLPSGDSPGDWMPKIEGPIVACDRGYHATEFANGPRWIHATAYEVESESRWISAEGKLVTAGPVRLVRRLKWDERFARLFAADCVEHELWEPGLGPEGLALVRECIAAARDAAVSVVRAAPRQIAARDACLRRPSAIPSQRIAWAADELASPSAGYSVATDVCSILSMASIFVPEWMSELLRQYLYGEVQQ